MDNKLFKRIVAVAASAVMLTSSVLATELTVGEDAWNDTAKELTFSYTATGATKVTYLARAAREATAEELADETFKADYTDTTNGTKYVFGEIVAVDQIDSVPASGETKTVPVNDGLLTVGEGEAKVDATHIVLMSGSDLASTADVKVVPTTKVQSTFAVTIVANDGVVVTEGDTIPENGNYSSITLPVLQKNGFTFMGWSDGTTIIPNSNTANQTVTVSAITTYTAIFEANAPTYTYNVAVQNVTYNRIPAKVLRLTGLDPAAVSVKVGTTVGQYYTRTTDSEKVIVLCVATDENVDYANTDAVKALISIEAGTTSEIKYGDVNYDTSSMVYGNNIRDTEDAMEIDYAAGGITTTGRGGRTYTLPTDLMTLLRYDVTADGSINTEDAMEIDYAAGGITTTGRGGKSYSIPTMGCYTN